MSSGANDNTKGQWRWQPMKLVYQSNLCEMNEAPYKWENFIYKGVLQLYRSSIIPMGIYITSKLLS